MLLHPALERRNIPNHCGGVKRYLQKTAKSLKKMGQSRKIARFNGAWAGLGGCSGVFI